MFQITMHCQCCKGRTYWFSKKEISQNGCLDLDNLATQVEELCLNGVDICSQNTYSAEDFDDDIEFFNDTEATNLNNEIQST